MLGTCKTDVSEDADVKFLGTYEDAVAINEQ